jgi:hypothetical protein
MAMIRCHMLVNALIYRAELGVVDRQKDREYSSQRHAIYL